MHRIIQLGLGPIGQRLTRYLSERKGIQVVGAVDPDPKKVGKDLGEHAEIENLGVSITSGLKSCPTIDQADIAVVSTVSSLEKIEDQIQDIADYGLDIVSTCEELSHPWQTKPELAHRIDDYCKKQNISCVGTGVNPGFLMDFLPSVLTSVCRKVKHIKVERVQDARPRRKPFRDKIGAGLTESEFEEKRERIRHVGLPESVYLIADAMNWELTDVDESLEPIQAKSPIQTESGTVPSGNVAGVRQVALGLQNDREVIRLVFEAAVGIEESHDSIYITGNPTFNSTIDGGINGDIATSAIIVNAVRAIQTASPGLKTMLDIQAPAYFSQT
ncbi:MAG: dihydrodipicolinate reductase [Aliifodinibius sp.]|nr:dihydrodipicolinate reductase [Fodinibius sp.]NIV16696.1 dihydrodipicolinate reductase [Fodinibius sp.]NIY30697.1 dihydrodipicolinate reductase [Fodinibius sp.]